MGKIIKKGKAGTAAIYINRTQACKRLQLSLASFRRLCILKGIYPKDPKHRNKLDKGKKVQQPATYYLLKDIQFLAHEPLIEKFREFRVFCRKLKTLKSKKEYDRLEAFKGNKPNYTYDHIIKERYPTFLDALRDLDDCLTLCFLFSRLPKMRSLSDRVTALCTRLTVEFMFLVICKRALRKVFLSIKGIYYQIELEGQVITWLVPYQFPQQMNRGVDFRIMVTFLDFYSNLLGFVNHHLFTQSNFKYPPKFSTLHLSDNLDDEISWFSQKDSMIERLALFCQTESEGSLETLNKDITYQAQQEEDDPATQELLQQIVSQTNPEHSKEQEQNGREFVKETTKIDLFSKCKFFLNRETPRDALTFVIKCFGGQVSLPYGPGSHLYSEADESITHQIVDRTIKDFPYKNRVYIQPQWVFDCVNSNQLLPTAPYFANVKELPAHLSPFYHFTSSPPEEEMISNSDENAPKELSTKDKNVVRRKHDDIVVANNKNKGETKKTLSQLKKMKSESGLAPMKNMKQMLALEGERETERLRELMIPKKQRRLYAKMKQVEKYRRKEVETLRAKKRKLSNNVNGGNESKRS